MYSIKKEESNQSHQNKNQPTKEQLLMRSILEFLSSQDESGSSKCDSIFKTHLEYETNLPTHSTIAPYRMNLLAVSHLSRMIFVGCGNEISYFPIIENGKLSDKKQKQSYESLQHNSDNNDPILLQVSEDKDVLINQLKLAFYQGKEILVAVDMSGFVTVFNVNNLREKPIILDNRYDGIEDCSTWSLDVFLDEHEALLACGSNARRISVWRLSQIFSYQEEGLLSQRTIQNRRVIEGIHHNVPCVQFSPCGMFLAAVSIDQKVRVFRVSDCEEIMRVALNDWGWTVNWSIKAKQTNFNAHNVLKDIIRQSSASGQSFQQEKQQLTQYLLLVTTSQEFFLIDIVASSASSFPSQTPQQKPSFNSASQQTSLEMKIIDSLDFNLRNNLRYRNVARYSLVHFDRDSNFGVATPQHTPFVHSLQIVYNANLGAFQLNKTNIDLTAQLDGFTIGSYLYAKPSADPFSKLLHLFVLNINKHIRLFSLNYPLTANSNSLQNVADYSNLTI